ncbi:MAG: ribosomal protein [Candidatus Parcubacteria bacterium]|jgi:large subunit ribosomal protein L21
MEDFSVIKTGGKQYRVSVGSRIRIEKVSGSVGDSIVFSDVLLRRHGSVVEVGTPVINAPVSGSIVALARDRKKIIFKYHSKTRYHKTRGHRQQFADVEITAL